MISSYNMVENDIDEFHPGTFLAISKIKLRKVSRRLVRKGMDVEARLERLPLSGREKDANY